MRELALKYVTSNPFAKPAMAATTSAIKIASGISRLSLKSNPITNNLAETRQCFRWRDRMSPTAKGKTLAHSQDQDNHLVVEDAESVLAREKSVRQSYREADSLDD